MPSGVQAAGAALGFSAESGLQMRGPGVITATVPCGRPPSLDPRGHSALRPLRVLARRRSSQSANGVMVPPR